MGGNGEDFSFSPFVETAWKSEADLIARARGKKLLISDVNGKGMVAPSLDNIRHNFTVLRAYTRCMAENGFIVTKHIEYLKEPITGFYQMQKIDTKSEHAVGVIHGTAGFVKRMLHVIKKKWSRWEIPRETMQNFSAFLHGMVVGVRTC